MLCAIGHYLYCRGRNTNNCLHLHLRVEFVRDWNLLKHSPWRVTPTARVTFLLRSRTSHNTPCCLCAIFAFSFLRSGEAGCVLCTRVTDCVFRTCFLRTCEATGSVLCTCEDCVLCTCEAAGSVLGTCFLRTGEATGSVLSTCEDCVLCTCGAGSVLGTCVFCTCEAADSVLSTCEDCVLCTCEAAGSVLSTCDAGCVLCTCSSTISSSTTELLSRITNIQKLSVKIVE